MCTDTHQGAWVFRTECRRCCLAAEVSATCAGVGHTASQQSSPRSSASKLDRSCNVVWDAQTKEKSFCGWFNQDSPRAGQKQPHRNNHRVNVPCTNRVDHKQGWADWCSDLSCVARCVASTPWRMLSSSLQEQHLRCKSAHRRMPTGPHVQNCGEKLCDRVFGDPPMSLPTRAAPRGFPSDCSYVNC